MDVTPLEIGRFKRLAIRSSDVWQGGVMRLPAWVQASDDDPPHRVRGAVWLSTRTGLIWITTEDDPATPDLTLALRGLVDFAKKYDRELMGRPSRLEVLNAPHARELDAALHDPHTTVAAVRDLPNVRDVLRRFEEDHGEGPLPVPLVECPGVTLDGLRGFADAAARFYHAHVWHALDPDEDLVTVESPIVDPALRHLVVIGSTPATRGLTFFSSPKAFEKLLTSSPASTRRPPAVWMLSFGAIDELPFGDVDAWLDHGLPVASPEAYPQPVRIGHEGASARPDAARLHYLEAVLCALAESTDADFDSGRWTRRVDTSQGPVDVRLSLPRLLEAVAREDQPADVVGPPDIPAMRLRMESIMRRAAQAIEQSGASTLEEAERIVAALAEAPRDTDASAPPARLEDQAQQLAYEAMVARGRHQFRLAHRALALWNDCADARLVLGHRAPTPAEAIARYQDAVAAAERTLGPEPFARDAGRFWTTPKTGPYLRARLALAAALEQDDRLDDAVTHYRDVLRLDADDRLGVRYRLLRLLLERGQNDDAQALVDQFGEDAGAEWRYAGALVAFRRQAPDAAARLRLALAANRHVPAFLTGAREIPELPDMYAPGSVDEAIMTADALLNAWNETPGALLWLNGMQRLGGQRPARARKTRAR